MSTAPSSCPCGWSIPPGEPPATCPDCGARLRTQPRAKTRFGPYELGESLGAGSMGKVLSALDRRSGERVALKLLLAGEGNEVQRARFQREARALARVSHPNLIAFREAGEIGGQPFLAMELVEGSSLAELCRTRTFSPEEAVRIGVEVADALGALHAAGVVHRDVKFANVLLDETGRARLVDLGVARGEELGRTRLTRTGALVGTPHCMAPEQLDRPEDVGPPTDVYALGCLLYELVAGRPPFLGETLIKLLREIAGTTPTAPGQFANVPPALDALILRMLAKEPAERFADGAQAGAALRRAGQPSSRFGSLAAGALAFLLACALGFVIARGRTPAVTSPTAHSPAPSAPLLAASPERLDVPAAEAALAVAEVGTATVLAKKALAEALEALRAAGEASQAHELRLLRLYAQIGDLAGTPLADDLLTRDLAPDLHAEVVAHGAELLPESAGQSWLETHADRIRGQGPNQEWVRALLAAAQGNPSESLAHLKLGIELDGDAGYLRVLHATTLLRMNVDPRIVRAELEPLVDAAPHVAAQALLALGFLRFRQGDQAEALRFLDRAELTHPDAGIEAMRGQALLFMGQHKAALGAYMHAIELGRETSRVRRTAMRLLFSAERFEEALTLARREAAERPDSSVAAHYEFLGELWTGHPQEALLALGRAWLRAKDPVRRRNLTWNVGRAARDLGDWEHSGAKLLAWVAERDPQGELHTLLRAWHAVARGEVPRALHLLVEAGDDAPVCRLARLQILLPRSGPAIHGELTALARRATDLADPGLLARVSQLESRKELAFANTTRALKLAQSDPELLARVALARVSVLLSFDDLRGARALVERWSASGDSKRWWQNRHLVPPELGAYHRALSALWMAETPRDQQADLRKAPHYAEATRLMALLDPLEWVGVTEFQLLLPNRADSGVFLRGRYLPMLGWRGRLSALAQLSVSRRALQQGDLLISARYLLAARAYPFQRIEDRTLVAGYMADIGYRALARGLVAEVLGEARFYSPARRMQKALTR